jgi:hypothetical protein
LQSGVSIDFHPFALLLLPVYLALFWCLLCYSISFLSGWHSLTRRFRAQHEPYGQTASALFSIRGVRMRFRTNYDNIIRLTVAEDALYLSVLFALRIGHPPLCIPWSEIKISKGKFLWMRFVLLTLGEQEKIPLCISERMAAKLGLDSSENRAAHPRIDA